MNRSLSSPAAGNQSLGLALLLLLGSLGLLLHAHETLPENASLAGLTLCWWGLMAAAQAERNAPWLLGSGLAISLLAKGALALALPLSAALLLPLLSLILPVCKLQLLLFGRLG